MNLVCIALRKFDLPNAWHDFDRLPTSAAGRGPLIAVQCISSNEDHGVKKETGPTPTERPEHTATADIPYHNRLVIFIG